MYNRFVYLKNLSVYFFSSSNIICLKNNGLKMKFNLNFNMFLSLSDNKMLCKFTNVFSFSSFLWILIFSSNVFNYGYFLNLHMKGLGYSVRSWRSVSINSPYKISLGLVVLILYLDWMIM